MYVTRFTVAFEYPVCFTRDALAPENPTLRDVVARLEPHERHRLMAVIDDGVARAWPDLPAEIAAYFSAHDLELAGEPLVVPGGEVGKNDPAAVQSVHAALHARGIDRHSGVLVVGGGACQDMVGYAAATAHRGVRVVRMPTTVLSQNDSGVGVKNGVNAFDTKNFVGTFAPPFGVVDDSRYLATLDERDRRAGLAEAVKVALIRDARFFEWLEEKADALARFDDGATCEMIRRCALQHLEHIASSGDPFERGSARPLDYGHWAAHKLEVLTHHALRHGEAVAIGMALDTRYAALAGMLDHAVADRICAVLEGVGLALWHEALDAPELIEGLREFREHLGGKLTVPLLTGIGRRVDVHTMDEARIRRAIDALRPP